jgi:hypothetical protein
LRGVVEKMETPWGCADHVTRVCPGVQCVSTPGHGGYAVLPTVVATWPAGLREYVPFAGPGWYEEDCDWAIVVLAMPQNFKPHQHAAAVQMIRWMTNGEREGQKSGYAPLHRWLNSAEAKPVLTRVDEWLEANARAGRYQSSSAGSCGNGWRLRWEPFRFQAFAADLKPLYTFHERYPSIDGLFPTRDELVALYGVVRVGDDSRQVIAKTPESICEVAKMLGWTAWGTLDRSFSSLANQGSALRYLNTI